MFMLAKLDAFRYGVLLLLVLMLLRCSNYDGQTEHGYDYWHHLDFGGVKPAIGDEVYVYFQIRTLDTLLFTSDNGKVGLRTVLQDPALNPIKKPDPVADVLPLMSEGDSVTVVMKVTDEMRIAPGLATADLLYYDVVLRKIIPAGSEGAQLLIDEYEEENPLAKPDLRQALEQNPAAEAILAELERFKENYRQGGTSTKSGLWYTIVDAGNAPKVKNGEVAQLKYIGCLQDGIVFGENFTIASPFSFTAGQGSVIKAWEEALSIIGPGGQLFMAVPPALSYGKLGKAPFIQAQDTLFYYLKLEEAAKLSK
ncbi:FKBP-type peptidyl-prolyl cis-trans isomerase [Lewinella sp. LCG006]|uniref:FKBP-type peptidyl-prolyl cis-trans isomerase n=1 Tax=Lewinella sp. LCG006 TaxID=3231911 RepID=UPI00345F87A5